MSVRTAEYQGNLVANTARTESPSIWGRCPLSDFPQGAGVGTMFYDDFVMTGNTPSTSAASYTGSLGQWSVFMTQAGVLGTDPNLEGGVILLSDGGTDDVNISLTSSAAAWAFQGGSTAFTLYQPIWFECRVAVGSITTAKRDCFIGLTSIGAPATDNVTGASTNTLATGPSLFGFHFRSTSNPTDVGLAFNVAGGTVQYPAGLQTLVTTVTGSALTAYSAGSGFVKLGFLYTPFASSPGGPAKRIVTASDGQTAGAVVQAMVTIFVNGLPAPAFLTSVNVQAATFPASRMSPAIAYCSRSASSAGGFYVDWIRGAGLAVA